MQPRLLKTIQAEYVQETYSGKNLSGWKPVGDRVLVKSDKVAETNSGGIIIPDDMQSRMNMASTTGVVIELGDDAFKWNSDRTRPFEGSVPKVGQRIVHVKYAGVEIIGTDGEIYRMMDDKEIGGIQL